MKELLKRARMILICTAIALTVFTYLAVFRPMKNELEKSIIDNYIQLVNSKYNSFSHVTERSIEGAESLASRTMIRNKIAEYVNRAVTFDELKEYTQPKYEDGATVLSHLISAERVVEQKTVAKYMDEDHLEEKMLDNKTFSHEIHSTIELVNQEILYRVSVPILYEGETLGQDFLTFNLTGELDNLSNNIYQVKLLTAQQYNTILPNMTHIHTENRVMLYENKDHVLALIKLESENYFAVEVANNQLFYTLQRLEDRIIILWIVVFGTLFALIYLYIIRFANKELKAIKISRDKYKGLVNKDEMTKAYAKPFLDVWKETLRAGAQYYTIMMIDIDNFKQVNDRYGHFVGDEVLKAVAGALNDTIRKEDYLIRFGGDEFIILLKKMREKDAIKMVEQLNQKIKEIDQFNFRITVSLGMATVDLKDNFEEKFKLADDRMYQNKQKKKLNS